MMSNSQVIWSRTATLKLGNTALLSGIINNKEIILEGLGNTGSNIIDLEIGNLLARSFPNTPASTNRELIETSKFL